jgi:hypothetical protein
MIDRTKRCYLYIRVSTDKQEEEGYSLPEQEDRLRAEAEKKGSSTHSVVFGGTMSAVTVWAKAATPTAAQIRAARAEVRKKAGLAAA